LLAAGGAVGLRLLSSSRIEDTSAGHPPPPGAAAMEVSPQREADDVRAAPCYLGVVVTREVVDLAAEIEGRLEEIRVRVGDRVKRDQSIATLDTRTLSHQLTMERAALRTAEANQRKIALEADRAAQEHRRRLALEDLVSREETESSRFQSESAAMSLEVAEAEVAQVEARIEQLDTRLALSEIRAPFNGTVAARYLDPGALAAAGTPVVRLINTENLLTRFAVSPEEVATFRPGTPVRVEIESPAIATEGTVDHLAPEIDAASQMVFIEARLTPAAGEQPIPSGAIARVSVQRPGETLRSCLGL
ncbi:MAG: efflux RND transporter periplasmic adaptor subunit, partial [bacterium]|nr:efflux RND transporter periplasmic adaptor subunit [bacterium]